MSSISPFSLSPFSRVGIREGIFSPLNENDRDLMNKTYGNIFYELSKVSNTCELNSTVNDKGHNHPMKNWCIPASVKTAKTLEKALKDYVISRARYEKSLHLGERKQSIYWETQYSSNKYVLKNELIETDKKYFCAEKNKAFEDITGMIRMKINPKYITGWHPADHSGK